MNMLGLTCGVITARIMPSYRRTGERGGSRSAQMKDVAVQSKDLRRAVC